MTGSEHTGSQREQSTREKAGEEAGRMADTARHEASQVADEAKRQGRHLYDEMRSRAQDEARHQTDRAADNIRAFSNDLRRMAESPDGTETDAAKWMEQGAERLDRFADRVGQRGFDGLMEDVKGFARRNPGTFLVTTFAAGLLAGRVARNADMGGGGEHAVTGRGPGQTPATQQRPRPRVGEKTAPDAMPSSTGPGSGRPRQGMG